ncbi:MAG: twitching motility protein PilT [Lachnospiraceae bacterium]|nr:twitching motility protein PilT [Lachnospiraceae bacterium]MBP3755384.1 twitching motility protein PilT [Lachnospiraceae bacterium]
MVSLIVGQKGKGKTKELLDRVNADVKNVSGNIVYLDKDTAHMYELNNKIRLINVSEFDISNSDQFYGFVAGIISQNHDIQEIFIDSYAKISQQVDKDITENVEKLAALSDKYKVDMVLSVSIERSKFPAGLQADEKIAINFL